MMNLVAIVAAFAVVPLGLTGASPISTAADQLSDESLTVTSKTIQESAWSEAGSLFSTPTVNVQSDWKWSCPRRGTVSKTFKWRGWIQNSVVKLEPLDNVDFFDTFKSSGPNFTSLWHHNYCVQEKTFNCLYKVTGCTIGQVRGNFLTLGLVTGEFIEKPKVEEACVDTSTPLPAGKCPTVPDTAYKACDIVSAKWHNI